MNKKIRDFIFFLFIACFLLGTLSISLYASGYELKLSWPPRFSRLLVKTGMIAVDSSPAGARIFLNEEAATSFSLTPWAADSLSTPAKIRNVAPGSYELRLELDGYRTFSKNIDVYPGQTAFLEDLNLFRSDLPLLAAAGPEGALSLSPNGRYLYAAGSNRIITLSTGLAQDLPAQAPAAWLPDSDRLLQDGRLISANGGTSQDYRKLVGPEATNWHYDESNDRLYYENKDSLAYLDTGRQNSAVILSGDAYLSYEARGDALFVAVKSGGKTFLRKYSVADRTLEQEISLPSVGLYRFRPDGRPLLALYDEQNKTLYLIDPDDIAAGRTVLSNVLNWRWTDDNTVFYNNTWEIYRRDLRRNDNALITRVGEAIRDLDVNAAKNYLVFATDRSLNAFDLATGSITRIFQAEKVAAPVLDAKNDILYFWAKVGQQEGVYSLLMQ